MKSSRTVENIHEPMVRWMWAHRKGWRSYDFKVNQKIESAFLSGAPSVELVNPFNKNALQIDFTNMQQCDLKSQNTRPVRRQEFTLINENGSSCERKAKISLGSLFF